jgi:hypothetical protein
VNSLFYRSFSSKRRKRVNISSCVNSQRMSCIDSRVLIILSHFGLLIITLKILHIHNILMIFDKLINKEMRENRWALNSSLV